MCVLICIPIYSPFKALYIHWWARKFKITDARICVGGTSPILKGDTTLFADDRITAQIHFAGAPTLSLFIHTSVYSLYHCLSEPFLYFLHFSFKEKRDERSERSERDDRRRGDERRRDDDRGDRRERDGRRRTRSRTPEEGKRLTFL